MHQSANTSSYKELKDLRPGAGVPGKTQLERVASNASLRESSLSFHNPQAYTIDFKNQLEQFDQNEERSGGKTFLLISSLLLAINAALSKTLAGASAWELLCFRSIFGLVLFFFYFKFVDSTFIYYDARDKRVVQVTAVLSVGVGYAFFEGVSSALSLGEALGILNSANIFDWLFAKMLRNENPTQNTLISAALSVAGTVTLIIAHVENDQHYGCFVCLAGALALSLIETVYRTKQAHISPLCLLFFSMMVSAIFSPVAGAIFEPFSIPSLSGCTLYVLLALSYFIGMLTSGRGRDYSTSDVPIAIAYVVQILAALALDVAFFGTQITVLRVIGLILIIGGNVYNTIVKK